MFEYRTPRRDLVFLLQDVLDAPAHFAKLTGEPASMALVEAVLDEAGRFAEQELAPLNSVGDIQGCRLEGDAVSTPDGFKEAYQLYVEGGWAGIAGEPEHGGQGLPESVALLVEELFSGANMAWAMYSGLSRGAIHAIEAHGSKAQQALYLPKLLSGNWTGTMCLTEPHCGSDVGLLSTRAGASADGTYQVTGTKIFISAGEHDLAENIVHLVLARIPGAPAGTKGISLFIVPKWLPAADGSLRTRNGVQCGALEDKMGIHGNSTCLLNFDGATGFLLGEENQGMRAMFTMMNGARLSVGLQGVCLMEAGFQASLAYAQERAQMRSISGAKNPDGNADPIIVHADVRRMLLTQKCFVEGGRAMTHYVAQLIDLANQGPVDERGAARSQLDFLTPITKAFLTEVGFESVNHALQIYGGHGFIRENGVEQLVRDARITTIYEGTTQIQALDLLARKVMLDQGAALQSFVKIVNAMADDLADLPFLRDHLRSLVEGWQMVAMKVGERALGNPDEIGAASYDFLMFSGYAVMAYFWARMARAARRELASASAEASADPFLVGKLAAAQFFFERLLPRADAHRRALLTGGANLMEIDANEFAHV